MHLSPAENTVYFLETEAIKDDTFILDMVVVDDVALFIAYDDNSIFDHFIEEAEKEFKTVLIAGTFQVKKPYEHRYVQLTVEELLNEARELNTPVDLVAIGISDINMNFDAGYCEVSILAGSYLADCNYNKDYLSVCSIPVTSTTHQLDGPVYLNAIVKAVRKLITEQICFVVLKVEFNDILVTLIISSFESMGVSSYWSLNGTVNDIHEKESLVLLSANHIP